MPRPIHLSPIVIALAASPAVPMARNTPPSVPVTSDVVAPIAAAPARSIKLERAPDGLFYVDARVNNALIHFVVDTGSSVVILNQRDAVRAGVGSAEAVDVDTAAGSTAMQRARIDRVALAGQVLTGIDAAIVSKDLQVSLLGQSVLSQLGSVTLRDGQIELEARASGATSSPSA